MIFINIMNCKHLINFLYHSINIKNLNFQFFIYQTIIRSINQISNFFEYDLKKTYLIIILFMEIYLKL